MTDQRDEQFGQRLTRMSHEDAPRAEHSIQLRQETLAAFDDAQSNIPWTALLRFSLTDWRTTMSRPLPRIAVSLLVIVAVTLSVVLISPDNANNVWANMVENILNAKSAKFKVAVAIEGQATQTFDAMVLEPNRYRQEMAGGAAIISDWNAGKMVSLVPGTKSATVVNIVDRPNNGPSQSFFQQIKDQLLEEQTNPEIKREPLGEKVVDGHPAVGSRITSHLQTMTIWGDPTSGLPYRIESSMKMMPNAKVVMSDFQLNVDLDESLFSVVPPSGYSVVETKVEASTPTEKDFLTALRTYSDKLDGTFPGSLDMKSWMAPLYKKLRSVNGNGNSKPSEKATKELLVVTATLARGFGFALALAEQTEATYAGEGIQRSMVDTPIFWYKPEGAAKYRVVYADLSIKDLDAAPKAENAQRLSEFSSEGS